MSETICFCTNKSEDEVIDAIKLVVKATDIISEKLVDKVHEILDAENNGETPRCRGCVPDITEMIEEYIGNGGKL